MLDLDPDDDLKLIAETARKFAEEALAPRLREAEAERCVDESVHALYSEIGLAGLDLPEELGGAGLGALARVLVNEELAAADPGASLALDAYGAALYAIQEFGGAEAVAELQSLLEKRGPQARAWLVFEEDAPIAIENNRMTSMIPWLPCQRIDALVWISKSEACLITDGLEAAPLRGMGLRAAGASELRMSGAPIAMRWENPQAANRARARARLSTASLLLGVLRHSCDFSREYARERQAFGRPIAHHQALAFMITEMQMALDGSRLLIHEAAWHIDSGRPAGLLAASAFAQCIESARFIGPNGVQILGGHGFMADYPVEKAMREARALSLLHGGLDAAIEDAGQEICDAGAPVTLGMQAPQPAGGVA